MNACYICQGKGKFLHIDRFICNKCFIGVIERRVKRHMGRRLFKKGDKVLVTGEVEKVLLEEAIKGLPLKITYKKVLPKRLGGYDFVVVGKTMDEVDEEFLEELFKGKLIKGKLSLKENKSMRIARSCSFPDKKSNWKLFQSHLTNGTALTSHWCYAHTNKKKFFNILEPLTEEEVEGYAKVKRVHFEPKKRDNSGKQFLNKLKGFKELKYNLYGNIKEIKEIRELK